MSFQDSVKILMYFLYNDDTISSLSDLKKQKVSQEICHKLQIPPRPMVIISFNIGNLYTNVTL